MRGVVWLLLLLGGCGRIAFDPRTSAGDGALGDTPGADGTFTGQRVTYVKAPNTDVSDFFGSSVATSADGNTVVVGAPGEDGAATTVDGDMTNDAAGNAGAAYVLVRSGSTWSYQGYLKAINSETGDSFGNPVAISGDGNTIAVGAVNEDGIGTNPASNAGNNVGAVYVFIRNGASWQFQAYVKGANSESFDDFGFSVALSGDGNMLVVGADGEASALTGTDPANPNDNTAAGAGAVYVFSRLGTTWVPDGYIKASNTDSSDLFGTSVAVSGDGNTFAVGAIQESSALAGIGQNQANNSLGNSGAAYVFVRSGITWAQQEYIKASNPIGGGNFGRSVSLSQTGDTLVVGARGESSPATGIGGPQTNGGAFASGASYVFERTGTSWVQSTYVKATNTDANDEFGKALWLASNAQFLAVGAEYEASASALLPADNSQPSAGAVYVYARTTTSWEPRAYLKSASPEMGDNLGSTMALSGDGAVLAIGVPGEDGSGMGVGVSADEAADDSGSLVLVE